MKTKTTIPWAAILNQYNANFGEASVDEQWYICHLSPIFKSLWRIDEMKLEIKKLMAEFLKVTKEDKEKLYVILDNCNDCLLYGRKSYDELSTIKKEFLEYMAAKSKPKTKYSYFRHAANYCFGNPGGPAFLIRRDNKTGEFDNIKLNIKGINPVFDKRGAEQMVECGSWVPANQKEINKIKRLYREPKYLYYRHKEKHLFGNPDSTTKHLMRYEPKKNDWFTYSYCDGLKTERNNHYLWNECVKDGDWIPARQKEIRLAIKLNK